MTPVPLRSRQKAASFPRRRSSQCWSDTVQGHDLTAKEIKRQEVTVVCVVSIRSVGFCEVWEEKSCRAVAHG